jgi:2',3'-cyclic-nucleotide 2'-phosphodiesterase (5'-nucleotidase family)
MTRTLRLALALVAALTLLLTLTASPAAAAGKKPAKFWLTILHNNDGESRLLPLEIENEDGEIEQYGGVARFKTVVDRLKREALRPRNTGPRGMRGVLMLSSGDNFLAGPQFTASLEKGVPFFDSIAMDLIGYDAAAIGNHEFDFGPEVLADFINGFRKPLPFLSANLDFSAEPSLQALVDSGRIAPSVVVRERGRRIGVVGATTPLLPSISSPRGVVVDPDVAAEVQAEVDALEADGVNKIVLISHLQSIEEDRALALELSGVDIMISGGGGELLANPGDRIVPGDSVFGGYPQIAANADGVLVPIVTTPGDYAYVGRLVAAFNRQGELLRLNLNKSGPKRVSAQGPDAVRPDRQMQRRVVEPVQEAVAELAANVVATSEVDLDGQRPSVRTRETNEGNLIADSLLWQAGQLAAEFGVPEPDVALQNGGGIRNDSIIPAGEITELDTFDMVPFANFVAVVPEVPPDQFKEILENAVSNVENVDGRFAQIAGFSFTWDANGTPRQLDDEGNVVEPGTRVQEVELDDGTAIVQGGEVVIGAPNIDVATIDFLARGGDQYPFGGLPFTSVGVSYQQALLNYIQQLPGTPLPVISAADYPEGGEGRITRLN